MCHSCCLGRTPHPLQTVSNCLLNVEDTLTSDTVSDVIGAAQEPINNVIDTIGKLSQAASKMPYYKFNNMWSRQMQGAVRFAVRTKLNQD
jgi:hypothetical protein